MSSSSHFDPDTGAARLVDVSNKPVTVRTALAAASMTMMAETALLIQSRSAVKGDVLAIARIAAIGATKHTATLIPLCHAIPIEAVEVRFAFTTASTLRCEVEVRTSAKTGVEMEALMAATVACLTVYDMCKSVDRRMTIGPVQLLRKDGGASGTFVAADSG